MIVEVKSSKELMSEEFENYQIRIVEETLTPTGEERISCYVGQAESPFVKILWYDRTETDLDVIMDMAKVWTACGFPDRRNENGRLIQWTPEALHEWVAG